jgi:transcriptional regulator with XRE-family HTH domain
MSLPAVPRPSAPAAEPLLRDLVGAILRRERRRQDRTLQDVAAAARVSTAYLSEVERGRKEASSEVLAAVCGALGLALLDLVARAHGELAVARARGAAQVLDLTARSGAPARPLAPHGVAGSAAGPGASAVVRAA